MILETEGIVLKQVKTAGSRRMLTIFTKQCGKISAGSSQTEGGKGKSALGTRPFTRSDFKLFKTRENYSVSEAKVLDSFYSIGENVEKYMAASYVLELTDKLLVDEQADARLYNALVDFLASIENRPKEFETLVLAYMVKALDAEGVYPDEIKPGDLLFTDKFDIINILSFLKKESFEKIGKLTLDSNISADILKRLRRYFEYHLEISNLKSETIVF